MSYLALFCELGIAEAISRSCLASIRRASAGVAVRCPKRCLKLVLGSHCLTVLTGTLMGSWLQSSGDPVNKNLH